MAYIALLAVFQSLWLVTNCHQERELTGTAQLYGPKAEWGVVTDVKATLIPLEEPTVAAPPMRWIDTLKLPKKFDVLRMEEPLKTEIDSLESLPDYQCSHQFAELIQKAIYKDIPKEHANWIVIPWGFSRYFTDKVNAAPAHMDVLRDADIAALLQDYEHWSIDIMEFLAKNNDVKSSALAHYDGNVEQYAIEMLTLDHTINIWVPLKPVQDWPLAFIPADQCDETRTMIGPFSSCKRQHLQYLLTSETTEYDWYTRYNMQPVEVYVWDSRTVAHAAVKIGDGKGKRSYLATRLLIMHPKYDLSPSVSSPTKDSDLCYTDRLFDQVWRLFLCERTATMRLAEMGYGRRCKDPPTALSPSPSIVQSHVKHKRGILCQLLKPFCIG